MNKGIAKNQYFIFAFFFLYACVLTYPVIFNLNGYMLTESYPDISHSDIELHADHISQARTLLERRYPPLIINSFDVAQTFIFPGILFVPLLGESMYYNIFFLVIFSLGGMATFLLVDYLWKEKKVALLAGFLFMTTNYSLHKFVWGHTNIMQIQFIPLLFFLLEKLVSKNKRRDALFLGIVLFLQAVSSSQYTIYLSFIIPLYLLFRIDWSKGNKELFKSFFLSGIIAGILSAPFLIPRLILFPATTRTIEENLVSFWHLNSLRVLFLPYESTFLGPAQLLLVFLGMVFMFAKRKVKIVLPYAVLFVVAIFLMMGPRNPFFPYYWLYSFWPMVNKFRVPNRLFPFILLSSSVLGSYAVHNLLMIKELKKKEWFLITGIMIVIFLTTVLPSQWLSGHHIFFP